MILNSLQLHLLKEVIVTIPCKTIPAYEQTKNVLLSIAPHLTEYDDRRIALVTENQTEEETDKEGNPTGNKVVPKDLFKGVLQQICDFQFDVSFTDTDYVYSKLAEFLDLYSTRQMPKLLNDQDGFMTFGELIDLFDPNKQVKVEEIQEPQQEVFQGVLLE